MEEENLFLRDLWHVTDVLSKRLVPISCIFFVHFIVLIGECENHGAGVRFDFAYDLLEDSNVICIVSLGAYRALED